MDKRKVWEGNGYVEVFGPPDCKVGGICIDGYQSDALYLSSRESLIDFLSVVIKYGSEAFYDGQTELLFQDLIK